MPWCASIGDTVVVGHDGFDHKMNECSATDGALVGMLRAVAWWRVSIRCRSPAPRARSARVAPTGGPAEERLATLASTGGRRTESTLRYRLSYLHKDSSVTQLTVGIREQIAARIETVGTIDSHAATKRFFLISTKAG